MINIYKSLTPGGVHRRAAVKYYDFSDIKIILPPIKEQSKFEITYKTIKTNMLVINLIQELNKSLLKEILKK